MAELNMADALNLALNQEMENDESVVVLGEDVGVDGGVFRVTDGLLERYGERRVIDSPVAETALAGVSVGLAINGLKPVCEMQFSGFSYQGFHQMEAHAARMRWRTRGGHTVPMVLRMPYGAGVHALEHHSESKEVFYAHTPGLKMVIPSTPRNARALLVSAIRDPDPVVFFEPKAVYRAFREEVPDEEETLPLGESRIAREGDDLTMISYGAMLHRTLEAADTLAEEDGVEAEVIDLLSLSPLDHARFAESARRTGRVVIVHEAHRSFGPAGEIMARLIEDAFYYLEAPVRRVTGFDTIVPLFAREQAYLPDQERILAAARGVLND
ncbi:alpha-ketoacid dehydrogenase subunit beta [Modicisalibacter tunisiensis]|uniref:Alpha-ketoacid dehydrogenase subunit beta n=1 Tax=Modicisalibacter tunisiensis TaxID=390637 RepID=A0ABS7X236_9GAMM|nr:alpha-ketoacid dehydrogenase subunit beta [Modicisalibacter tunisiensis]MBZ9538141.1 alpha-ketoacid dehydrogenase subunit beta [Modicisalibacter tunisiensis]MBZ9568449.1 alpha-ketoacid dehydrogenase subunit beta [Modicisalibacter tunisiensis]